MDKSKANKLSALIWQDRLRMAIPLAVVFVVVAAIAAFYIFDARISNRTIVSGQVDSWSSARGDARLPTYLISVTLSDGSKVVATADIAGRAPMKGERIEVAKLRTALGRVRYEWAR